MFSQAMKKSAQDGTTVTLVPDPPAGENHPLGFAPTQVVLTFAATPTHLMGADTTVGPKFDLILRPRT